MIPTHQILKPDPDILMIKPHGKPVVVKAFSEIREVNAYDGIWANASLLHCPKGQIHEVFRRLVISLRTKGVWFMSFKYGSEETVDARGRFFNNYTADSLTELLSSFAELQIHDAWENTNLLRGKNQRWVNAIVKKQEIPT